MIASIEFSWNIKIRIKVIQTKVIYSLLQHAFLNEKRWKIVRHKIKLTKYYLLSLKKINNASSALQRHELWNSNMKSQHQTAANMSNTHKIPVPLTTPASPISIGSLVILLIIEITYGTLTRYRHVNWDNMRICLVDPLSWVRSPQAFPCSRIQTSQQVFALSSTQVSIVKCSAQLKTSALLAKFSRQL